MPFISFQRRVPNTTSWATIYEGDFEYVPRIGEEVSVQLFNESIYRVKSVWNRYRDGGYVVVTVKMELLDIWTREVVP